MALSETGELRQAVRLIKRALGITGGDKVLDGAILLDELHSLEDGFRSLGPSSEEALDRVAPRLEG